MQNPIIRLRDNVAAGSRLARYRPVSPQDFHNSTGQLILLVALSILLAFCSDWLASLPHPAFNASGPAYSGFDSLMLLLAAALAALWLTRDGSPLALAIMVFSTTPLLTLVLLPVLLMSDHLPESGWWLYSAVYLFCVLLVICVFARPVFLFDSDARFRLIKVPALFLIVWYLPVWYLAQGNYFWYADTPYDAEADAYAPYRNLDVEALYYSQHDLLGAALQRLLPQRPEAEDLYFIGFAGYARQNVFLNETRFARTLFDERFDTAGRSLLLANNLTTRASLPLASRSNLQLALGHIGTAIDQDNDVLLMFLSSHGSSKELSVDFWPMRLNDLTPQQLRADLDDAGIKWRIIIVSACHSGAFIEALRDPNTMVLTAAASDRTSFGCGDSNDMTYFGEALFQHQLSSSYSLEQAFTRAASEIAQRERDEGLESSNPQIYIGTAIRGKLERLAHRLETRLADNRHTPDYPATAAPAVLD